MRSTNLHFTYADVRDLRDLSRTAVESKRNRCCNRRLLFAMLRAVAERIVGSSERPDVPGLRETVRDRGTVLPTHPRVPPGLLARLRRRTPADRLHPAVVAVVVVFLPSLPRASRQAPHLPRLRKNLHAGLFAGTDTGRSANSEFLLTFQSNHVAPGGPWSFYLGHLKKLVM